MTNLIGSHVSGGKDLSKALEAAKVFELEAIQVFLSSPTSFRFSEVDAAIDEEFARNAKQANVKVFVHGPYLMNFGAAKDSTRWVAKTLLEKNIARAKNAGAEAVIFHAGTTSGDTMEEGLKRMGDTLLPLLEAMEDDDPMILLEPMAGTKASLCSEVESIPAYFEKLNYHEKLGLCLDTAHMLAAGEPLDEEGGPTKVLDRVGELIGFERIKLIHANDSKVKRGANSDRHQNLGLGFLGQHCWPEFFAHSGLVAPLVLETPGDFFENDLKILRETRG